MKAIISDIHANLEALHAVLEDTDRLGVEDIYCLGDIVGYGPDPRDCISLAMEWDVCLMGDHDHWAVRERPPLPATLDRIVLWTIAQIDQPIPDAASASRRRAFLEARPHSKVESGFLFVHGSPRNPLNEYVFPEDIYNAKKLDAVFALINRCCFAGHTHVPGIFTEDRTFKAADEVGYRLDGRKTLCNVGSVGQPRDGDWRASYAIFDGEVIRFRRVEYDVEETVRKIYDIEELENFLGERLREGR